MKQPVWKSILSKLPVFLFCILFLQGYKTLFDDANTTIGVALLTALLVFLKNDLGFDVKQAAISFLVLFLMMVISPRISMFNPYLGFFVHLISIGLILLITSHDVEQDNHVPFLLGYIFAHGYSVTGDLFTKRLISVVIIAPIIALAYYLCRKKDTQSHRTFKEHIMVFDLHSARFQWYLQMTITLSLTLFLGDVLHYPSTWWVGLAVLSLIRPKACESKERIRHRLPATIIGAVLCFVVQTYLVPTQYQTLMMLCFGFGMMFITTYRRKTIANTFSALISAMLVFTGVGAVALRIFSNFIGVGLVVVSFLVFNHLFDRLTA